MRTIKAIITYLDDDTSITRDALTASVLGVVVLVVAWLLMR